MHSRAPAAAPSPRTPGSPSPRRGATVADLQSALDPLRAAGRHDDAYELLLSAYAAVFAKNTELALLVAKLRHPGRRSERVAPADLQLLFEQLLGSEDPAAIVNQLEAEVSSEQDAMVEREIADAEAAAAERSPTPLPRRVAKGWRTTDAVEHEVHTHELPVDARRCPTCGDERRVIGHDVAHTLEFVPAHFIEHEYQLAKYACGRCKDGVTTASGPVRVLERSAAEASILADIVVSKYVDHCPLHRLHRIYDRNGVNLPVSTMTDWVAGVAELVEPLVERLATRVKRAYVVRTDATGLKVLDPASPAHIELGTLWCYVGDDREVVFRYTPTGEGVSGPWSFLAGREGYVQADAASVFDRLYTGQVAQAVEVGCLAHARRKFIALKDTDARMAYPLKQIARVYRIETLADAEGRSPEERARLRQQRSMPLLEKLHRWALAVGASEPPASELAKAVAYLLNHWVALTRFVTDGRLDLDNNLCERQLRSIALGRKNFLFSGSHAAACRAATLYSLMRTCAQYGVAPLPYLTDVLKKLAGTVDVFVIRPLAAGWRVLALQRALNTRCPTAWEPVHGHIESGEAPEDAAVREVREETGLAIARLYIVRVQPFYLHKTQTIQLAVIFAAFVDDGADVVIGDEHQRAEWLAMDEASARFAFPSERQSLREIAELLSTGDAGPVEDVMRVF